MKQEKNIQSKMKSEISINSRNGRRGSLPNFAGIALIQRASIFLTQNKGKGPPGRQRSPGESEFVHITRPPNENEVSARNGPMNEMKSNNQTKTCRMAEQNLKMNKQNFTNTTNSNFYKLLIFTIMKKQILFLALFSLVMIFTGIKSYGQVTYTKNLLGAPACTPAVPLTCVASDELHPLPGKVYTYTVTVPASSKVLWFVTDQATIVNGTGAAPVIQATRDAIGGKYVLTATAPYNDPNNTSATIDMSWKSFDGTANKVVLVAHVTDAAGCTNNVEVYRIEPSFAFTLDIAGLLDAGGLGNTECVSPVESATYDGTNLSMNYGENWVFFTVNAANFVNSWLPSFTATYAGNTAATVPVADIQWAYPADAVANTAWNAATVPVAAKVAGGAVGATGECIVVRVHIDNGNLPDGGTLTFGVNGVMFDPAALVGSEYANNNLKDLDNVASGPCANNVTDEATYTLSPRPTIVSATGTPLQNFEPKN